MTDAADTCAHMQISLDQHIGRFADKVFDWEAFPANIGYAELARGQMRYIGGGGSPKVSDRTTLPPTHFTLSLLEEETGTYAAGHSHEIEESFLVLEGELTVGWEKDGSVIEATLGPLDMVQNLRDVPHGFRNDGAQKVLMSVTVDSGRPLPPHNVFHPAQVEGTVARAFGARPGCTVREGTLTDSPLHTLIAPYLVRFADSHQITEAAGFERRVYVGVGGAPATAVRKELFIIPPGCAIMAITRPVEEAMLVIAGALVVGWQSAAGGVERRLGRHDLVLAPMGQAHYFRNDGDVTAVAWVVIGGVDADDFVYSTAMERVAS
ncbi:cupin [Novacetimonas hansenii]|uniref:cupin n=1 Tax=Novacetimonas hansenii TaxID=436 RepID=UPI00094FA44D|nr:cupin [Novacetimonas hansenii]MBL7235593.1 cupin [Novacetimonas hansenii]PYD71862.1 cupin [Novacetimonas hansenii]QOF94414.1 cupin [Novacetimonas hansenii]